MKGFYSLLLLLSSIVGGFAQKSLVPKEFQNESVVILEVSNVFSYVTSQITTASLLNMVVETKHVKVYLNDKNAVAKYSTFYTYKTNESDVIELTIIKPNNSKKTLTFADGIEEKESVTIPTFFRTSSKVISYYKFALPNLEPGDIIEYTTTNRYKDYGQLTTVFMRGEFPIVVNKVKIEMSSTWYYLNFNALNGAPTYKKESDKKLLYYTVKDTLLPKIGNDWSLPKERYVPHIKFQIRSSKTSPVLAFDIRDVKVRENGVITEADLRTYITNFNLNAYNILYLDQAAVKTIGEVLNSNPNLSRKEDSEEIIKLCWYSLRFKTINGISISKNFDEIVAFSDYKFAMIMSLILRKLNQKSDLFVCTDNKNLSIKEAICPSEINWGIRYNDKYITFPNYKYMQFGELTNMFEGQVGYAVNNFTLQLKDKKIVFTPIELPKRDYKENRLNEKVSVKLNVNEESKVVCERVLTSEKGFSGVYIPMYYNVNFDLHQLNYLHMNTIDSVSMYKGLNKNLNEQKKYNDQEIIANYYKDLKNSYEAALKRNYSNIDEYKSWKISSYGVTPDQPNFQIEETFTMEDMVTKVGNGYIIKLGLLVGKYTRFVEEDRIRNYGGMLDLTSTKQIEIVFTIPDGYKLSSNDDFNRSYTSSFVDINSSIKTEGNVVKIIITRDFKKQSFTKEEYQDVLKFYDMMFELSQGKIVIKK